MWNVRAESVTDEVRAGRRVGVVDTQEWQVEAATAWDALRQAREAVGAGWRVVRVAMAETV